jgi:hypothetical protein
MSITPFLMKYAVPNILYVITFIIGCKVSSQFTWLPYPYYIVGLAAIIFMYGES